MGKNFWIILSAAVVLVLGSFIVFGKNDDDVNSAKTIEAPLEVQADDHTEGSGPLTMIEYGDFQCPGCAAYFPVLEQLKKDFPEDLTFVFRHFPLASHSNAMAAHRAAEAAGKQGKFWEMHDLLYENQRAWTNITDVPAYFEGLAQQLNLDIEKYKSDAASGETYDYILMHMKSGNDLGVASTPTLYLNGEKLDIVGLSYDDLKKMVEDAAKEKAPAADSDASQPANKEQTSPN